MNLHFPKIWKLALFRLIDTKHSLFFGMLLGTLLSNPLAYADSSDHIGPDPIQSENCVTISPTRSLVCNGRQIAPDWAGTPTLTINCDPGIFVLITHRPLPTDSSTRVVRLFSEYGEFSNDWLALSEFQSGFLVFFGGTGSDNYERMARLIGLLMTPEVSILGFSFGQEDLEGIFELNYSDRNLVEQITSNC